MRTISVISAILGLFILSKTLNAQPIIDVYLSSKIPTSKGIPFISVEETHELLALVNGKAPIFKVVKKYNSSGRVTSEIKYNSLGGVQYETTWEYNSKAEPTRKFTRQFFNYKGWSTEEIILKYNDTSGCLQDITYYIEKVKKQYAQVTCDSIGTIKEVRVFNESGVYTNIERLLYVPSNNSLRVMVYRSNEQFVAAHIYPLDYSKTPPKSSIKRAYNDRGDIILEALPDSKLKQGYYYDYRYDSYGNWNLKLTYQCTVAENDKVKDKKLEHKIKRNITY